MPDQERIGSTEIRFQPARAEPTTFGAASILPSPSPEAPRVMVERSKPREAESRITISYRKVTKPDGLSRGHITHPLSLDAELEDDALSLFDILEQAHEEEKFLELDGLANAVNLSRDTTAKLLNRLAYGLDPHNDFPIIAYEPGEGDEIFFGIAPDVQIERSIEQTTVAESAQSDDELIRVPFKVTSGRGGPIGNLKIYTGERAEEHNLRGDELRVFAALVMTEGSLSRAELMRALDLDHPDSRSAAERLMTELNVVGQPPLIRRFTRISNAEEQGIDRVRYEIVNAQIVSNLG